MPNLPIHSLPDNAAPADTDWCVTDDETTTTRITAKDLIFAGLGGAALVDHGLLYVDSGEVKTSAQATYNDTTVTLSLTDGTFIAEMGNSVGSAGSFTDGSNGALICLGTAAAYFTGSASEAATLCDGTQAGLFLGATTTVGLGLATQCLYSTDGTRGAILCDSGTPAAARFNDATFTVEIANGVDAITYAAGNSANWAAGVPPTDVWVALDRIAAAVTTLGLPP